MVFGWGKKRAPTSPVQDDARRSRPVTLNMLEVYCFAFELAEARGWPKGPIIEDIAWRVLWLEQRRLPGLFALIHEVRIFGSKDFRERGRMCPIMLGGILGSELPQLVPQASGQAHAIKGPTHGILLLPKIARYVATTGELIRVSWLSGQPEEIRAQSIVSANAVATGGDFMAMLATTSTGFARHDRAFPLEPEPLVDEMQLAEDVAAFMTDTLGPARVARLKKVVDFLVKDEESIALFEVQTKGERTNFMAIGSSDPRLQDLSGQNTVLAVSADSTNGKLCRRLEFYGWFEQVTEGQEELRKVLELYVATTECFEVMPLIMAAISQFEASDRWQDRQLH